MDDLIILGGGITGLSAALASRAIVYEAEPRAGGICTSYYRSGYRFEKGGGHWIFGADPRTKKFIQKLSPCKSYKRNSAIYFAGNLPATQNFKGKFIPFPLQNNLWAFKESLRKMILEETTSPKKPSFRTLEEWLRIQFGETLCQIFFHPFHKAYTAGLYRSVAPLDPYKSPLDFKNIKKGCLKKAEEAGYNIRFIYPRGGLDHLIQRLTPQSQLRFRKKAVKIDTAAKIIYFEDGEKIVYKKLISSLPLNVMMKITGKDYKIAVPYTSVLVINIGAEIGDLREADHGYHWLYIPDSKTGFYRVGYYSNVDKGFLPKRKQDHGRWGSLYVEKSYPSNTKLSTLEIDNVINQSIRELREWGFIGQVEIIDPTWIEVAYTFNYPGSSWREKSIEWLKEHEIYQVGRFGTWKFSGIAQSIDEGLKIGLKLGGYNES